MPAASTAIRGSLRAAELGCHSSEGEGVEDAHGLRRAPGRQDEEAAGGGGDEDVVAEEWQENAGEAAGGVVEEEARVVVVGGVRPGGGELVFVQHDPPGGSEAGFLLVAPGVGGGEALVPADASQVHVVVEVAGGYETVGDAVDEFLRKRGLALRHGLDRPSWAPGCRDLFVVWCCADDVGEESRG